jgi:cell filamentation protein
MRNEYEYVDPDYQYTDPKTGVLRNLHNISNRDMLNIVESGASTKRANELIENPINIESSASLLEIHHHLFQDVYDWAGKLRTVEISKQGWQFFPVGKFPQGFHYIDVLVGDYIVTQNNDVEHLANLLAVILDSVNYLHPFREGNGRTQREFIRLLAFGKGYYVNLNPPDSSDIYERYMSGTIDGDVAKLQALMLELMND